MNAVIKVAISLAVLASSTGQLPKLIYKVQLAQLYLIKESQASKWGMPMLPPPQTLRPKKGKESPTKH
ncbi:MAG TPA: hypothetical protein VNJ08_10410 [Bacteriovoracaceae bacterium]|nr:hypothetical protein [Bacteriovoracaceae bacterium]